MNFPFTQGSNLPSSLDALFTSMRGGSSQTMPMPVSDPGVAPMPEPKAGPGVGAMLQRALPAVLAFMARKQGGPLAGAGLLDGYARGLRQQKEAAESAHQLELETIADEREREARRASFERQKAVDRANWLDRLRDQLSKINDPTDFAATLDLAERQVAPIFELQPGELKRMFVFPDSRAAEALQRSAAATMDRLRRTHGNALQHLIESGALVPFQGKPTPIRDVMAAEGTLATDAQGAPVSAPTPEPKLDLPNSDFGIRLQMEIEADEEKLGRKLRPGERIRARDRVLAAQAATAAARRSSGGARSTTPRPSAAPKPTNPRGSTAIPQGVESYILSMRARGYTQDEAIQEMFSAATWANMQRDHPAMTAQRASEAIRQLIPEEGAAPSAQPAGRRGGPPVPIPDDDPAAMEPPRAGAMPSVDPSLKTMTREELRALAEAFGIDEARARRIYESRGVTIR